jgi:putative membrane protein
MKSKLIFVSQFAIATGALFVTGPLLAQYGAPKPPSGGTGPGSPAPIQATPYQPDNPFFHRDSASPAPSAASKAAKSVSAKDKNFLTSAAANGAWEIETGKPAEKNAKGEATKQIAARMVADFSTANKELIDLAKKKGLAISTEGIKGQRVGEENFDQRYLNLLEQDYHEQIPLFEKEAKSGDDTDIKNWAARRLPTLRQHLSEVKSASAKVK